MKSSIFDKSYAVLFAFILLIELYIGFFIHDRVIRPYIGDLLVIILIYSFLRIFISKSYFIVALSTFIFACFVELAQYYNLISLLGLEKNRIASVVIGTSFSWIDILAYFGGFLMIILVEETLKKYINRT